ncbi:acyl carrier protein [Streptomyces sp. NPDC002926]
MSDLKSRVTGILVSTFGLEPAALAGSPTLESLEFDSLALVEFATALESEFSTPVDEEEITVEHTLDDVLNLLAQKLTTAGATTS